MAVMLLAFAQVKNCRIRVMLPGTCQLQYWMKTFLSNFISWLVPNHLFLLLQATRALPSISLERCTRSGPLSSSTFSVYFHGPICSLLASHSAHEAQIYWAFCSPAHPFQTPGWLSVWELLSPLQLHCSYASDWN